jgi:Rhs element Vgr protein
LLNELRTFFDHSRHTLWVRNVEAPLDVLAFHGEERLSQPFTYRVEFTCIEQDLAADQLLNQDARFSLHAVAQKLPYLGLPVPEVKPLRTLHGVVTGFQRLSGSNDEARYAITLQPRLALLGRGQQFRIYQHQSVPEIVEHILRSRHDFRGQDFFFDLHREYPKREQVMQYGESDLAFIDRLLAEVGIWYRFTSDERLHIDVVEFHDDQRAYQFDVQLPYRPPAGLSSSEQDGVWQLQTHHQVVEQQVNFRAYHYTDASAWLDGDIDQSRGAKTTYGEAYHYAEPYRVLGDALALDEDLQSESGYFYARLRHERYLNGQTRLSGVSSSATLAPGQVLKISGGAPQAFAPGAVIIQLTTHAARDASFEARFEAMPYAENVCFRPEISAKPQIAGTVPARVTSPQKNDPYAEIDLEGRYRVHFLFDRDQWPAGRESAWLRLARPYAGDTHGLHLPLIAGTEVAISFEQGDPDRPFIAHALHSSRHPDHVTLGKRDYTRNVLRTPANNKLRMEDRRGEEHVKLSTEYGGKSQLNLGHLVDAQKQKRGEGIELRTDGHGAIRSGKGLFISADAQPKAQGEQLDMSAAIAQLESALSLARSLAQAARSGQATPSDTDSQQRLARALKGLAQPGVLLHAPAGIGLVSPEAVCLSSGNESVAIMAAHNTDISAGRNITATAEGGVSLFAQSADLQLKAGQGKVELHAQGRNLHALAKTDIKIESVEGRVEISAPEELVLSCGGAYIRLKNGEIELGAPGNLYLKVAHVQKLGSASLDTPATVLPAGYSAGYTLKDEAQAPMPFARYRITTQQGEVFNGVTDKDGQTMSVHTLVPGDLRIEFPDSAIYDEQLRLVGPNGELASNLKYSATLADGSMLEGVTDAQGYTPRLVTQKPTQITHLTLFPPKGVEPFCCAAQNAQAPLEIDLMSSDISTNDTNVGSSIQNVPLPKGKKRALTSGEIAMARTVFKDAINYSKVKVHRGGWWLFVGFQNTAVTPNGEMYFPESTKFYRDDFSATDRGRDKALFMHEMTHVWQYQLGYSVKKHGLTVSSQGAEAYKYTLSANMTLSDYNMEQQGEIISDYYMICVESDPDSVWNYSNRSNDPGMLMLVLQKIMLNPSDKSNLPG